MVDEARSRALAALEDLYRRTDAAMALVPACDACGKCCHFKTFGHRLYASSLEALYLVSRCGQPGNAFGEDSCGYQQGNLCAAREGRTLACRVFSCKEPLRDTLYEDALSGIKRICLQYDVPYEYGPLQSLLAGLA